jgi:hypothetical protein
MKAVIRFYYDTDNRDEVNQIKDIQNAQIFKSILWDVDQKLRQQIKYNDALSEETHDALQDIRSFLHDCLNENDLNLLD